MPRKADLVRVVQRLSLCRDLDSVMGTLREAARDLTGADGVTVVLRDGSMCYYADENAIGPLWKGRRFPMETCISGWSMMHRQQVVIPDIYQDSRIPHDAYRPTFVKSLAMTPIRSENPIGAIGAYWADHHRATPDELQVLQALGDSASVALDNVQLIEQLREANRRKDQFISTLAHELRNPLAPIANALHLIEIADGDDEMERQARGMMQRQVQHLTRLVDDLLDVARLNRGAVQLKRERVDVARLAAQVAEDRRRLLEASGIKLAVAAPDTPVWISADPTRITQILGNLLDNARRFTPNGGDVAVRVERDDTRREVCVSVSDTGIGMDAGLIPHVFDAFSQADRSLDRSRGGLGLGLSVARGLAELHGGSIEAASAGANAGSTFTVRFPSVAEPRALRDTTVSRPRAVAAAPHVLVVEDNVDAAESMRLLLEAYGYDVAVAHSGSEGVAAARARPPRIVLCDIGLPGMDGFQVAAALRQLPETSRALLIAVTGYGQAADRQRAADAGFDLHLVKPVDPDRLLGEIALAPAS